MWSLLKTRGFNGGTVSVMFYKPYFPLATSLPCIRIRREGDEGVTVDSKDVDIFFAMFLAQFRIVYNGTIHYLIMDIFVAKPVVLRVRYLVSLRGVPVDAAVNIIRGRP